MTPHPILLKLQAVETRWKLLRFGELIAGGGILFSIVWFWLEWEAWRGQFTSLDLFYVIVVSFYISAFLVLVLLAFVAAALQINDADLAEILEKSCPSLMDRVNTLVYLSSPIRSRLYTLFSSRLEKQTNRILETEKFPLLFETQKLKILWGIFAGCLLGTVLFQIVEKPFGHLKEDDKLATRSNSGDSIVELKANDIHVKPPEQRAWGEVKIIDPGHDVKLTKVDVLALQIEMATSAPIQSPQWVTSLNGGPEVVHPLGASPEPNYAVYQPILYLDDLNVSDWDVVSYYAVAKNTPAASYSSKIYFIEIRPFHSDILKNEGKGKKKAHECLNEITGLIKEQSKVIQQTQVHENTAFPQDTLRTQSAHHLAESESDLALSTDHLFGKMAADGENTAIGDILDHLALAQKKMEFAAGALQAEVTTDGKRHELGALSELIATRKSIQKILSQDPSGEGAEDLADNSPTAESSKKLDLVSEMFDQDKNALARLHDLSTYQAALAARPGASLTAIKSENDVRGSLEKLIENNPDLFRGAQEEIAGVQDNIDAAMDDLRTSNGNPYLTRAADHFRDLEKAAHKNQMEQELAHAYALKKVIDQNASKLDQEKSAPGSLSPDDLQNLAKSSQHASETLKEINDDGALGAKHVPLTQALSPENQRELQEALENLTQATTSDARAQAADHSGAGLKKISQAFDQSQPTLTQNIRSTDQFKPTSSEALDSALLGLSSLMHKKSAPTPEEEANAEADILQNLDLGIDDQKAHTPIAKIALLEEAKDLLKNNNGLPIDAEKLKKLVDEIEAVRIEANDSARKTEAHETVHVDPNSFPVSYRDRIQSYYEDLSQSPP